MNSEKDIFSHRNLAQVQIKLTITVPTFELNGRKASNLRSKVYQQNTKDTNRTESSYVKISDWKTETFDHQRGKRQNYEVNVQIYWFTF